VSTNNINNSVVAKTNIEIEDVPVYRSRRVGWTGGDLNANAKKITVYGVERPNKDPALWIDYNSDRRSVSFSLVTSEIIVEASTSSTHVGCTAVEKTKIDVQCLELVRNGELLRSEKQIEELVPILRNMPIKNVLELLFHLSRIQYNVCGRFGVVVGLPKSESDHVYGLEWE
jgi:hypothetical protein